MHFGNWRGLGMHAGELGGMCILDGREWRDLRVNVRRDRREPISKELRITLNWRRLERIGQK